MISSVCFSFTKKPPPNACGKLNVYSEHIENRKTNEILPSKSLFLISCCNRSIAIIDTIRIFTVCRSEPPAKFCPCSLPAHLAASQPQIHIASSFGVGGGGGSFGPHHNGNGIINGNGNINGGYNLHHHSQFGSIGRNSVHYQPGEFCAHHRSTTSLSSQPLPLQHQHQQHHHQQAQHQQSQQQQQQQQHSQCQHTTQSQQPSPL